ncbi:MAG: alpha/beta hydrolase [Sphingobium sp.]
MREDSMDTEVTLPEQVIPERRIPLPRHISREAQDFLNSPLFKSAIQYPALEDLDGWRRYIALNEEGMVQALRARTANLRFDCTTHALSSASLYDVVAEEADPAAADRAVLYIHGGAYIVGGGEAAKLAAAQIACASGIRNVSLDYRMPPDHPYPAALEDAVEAYRWMLARYEPGKIAFYGGSAGANLALICLLKARDMGLPMPGALALHSPFSDMTQTGDSFYTNAGVDPILKERSEDLVTLFARGHDLSDPLISPAFADYAGFPPTILTTGTRDLLLSSTVLVHRAMRRAGVRADLHVWEAMPHGMPHEAPEAREMLEEQIAFLRQAIGLPA